MFEGDEKIFVEFLLFAAGLMFEAFALLEGVILLGIAGGDFLAVDATLEHFHCGRVFGREFGQRNQFLRQMRDKGRVG